MWIRQALPLRRRADTGDEARWLRAQVEALAHPRHADAEEAQNRRVADALGLQLEGWGYHTFLQGPHRNVIALPRDSAGPLTLVCAHYDSVPGTPGADDNASALAVMCGVARERPPGVAFAAFNREEDGMVGSTDFVRWLSTPGAPTLAAIHALEMVGYTDPRPGAQRVPPPFPRWMLPRDTGDFVAIVALGAGWSLADRVRRAAAGSIGVPPVVTLQAPAALLGWAPDLGRSDHLPFVQGGLPAVMWTDTADFRTPHYHQRTDAPDTLDYEFMAGVQRLLLGAIAASGSLATAAEPG